MYVRCLTMAIPHPNWTEPSLFKAVLWGILMAVPEGAALGMGNRGRGSPETPNNQPWSLTSSSGQEPPRKISEKVPVHFS